MSKQCHQHITIRAMGKSKHALNSLNTHFKICANSSGKTFTWCYYKSVLLQLGKVCWVLAILLFNHTVCSVIPVIDRKLIGGDNDDEHHSKLVQQAAQKWHKQWCFTSLCIYSHRVNCSGSTEKTVDHGPMGWLLERETTITTINHTPNKLQQMVEESHATDNIPGQHQ